MNYDNEAYYTRLEEIEGREKSIDITLENEHINKACVYVSSEKPAKYGVVKTSHMISTQFELMSLLRKEESIVSGKVTAHCPYQNVQGYEDIKKNDEFSMLHCDRLLEILENGDFIKEVCDITEFERKGYDDYRNDDCLMRKYYYAPAYNIFFSATIWSFNFEGEEISRKWLSIQKKEYFQMSSLSYYLLENEAITEDEANKIKGISYNLKKKQQEEKIELTIKSSKPKNFGEHIDYKLIDRKILPLYCTNKSKDIRESAIELMISEGREDELLTEAFLKMTYRKKGHFTNIIKKKIRLKKAS